MEENQLGMTALRWLMRRKKLKLVILSLISVAVALHFGYLSYSWIAWFRTTLVEDGLGAAQHHIVYTENSSRKCNVQDCLCGIVFARTRQGRLGNRLMEYASTWSVSKLYNLTPVVSDNLFHEVIPLFIGLSVSPVSKFVKDLKKRDADCAKFAKNRLLKGNLTTVQPWVDEKMEELMTREPIILRPYLILVETISRKQSALKEEFIYRPEFQNHAEQTLKKAARVLGDSSVSKEQIVYVGVHVRRTDYHRYLTRKFGVKKRGYATADYYVRAMQYMLKRISEKGSFKVVFAVASDDEEWCTTELIPALKNHLSSQRLLEKNATVQWCGSSDYRNDLVVLSSCNHSIISYGTYATWAALMAGGWTVVYNINPDGKKINGAMAFASLLPHWTTMH